MPRHLRFFFEAGVTDTPLWPDDTDSPYGYPCELERLPISQATRTELTRLCEHYQSPGGRPEPADMNGALA
ncbi:hypothetical protein [Streptomyces noursei]|uniref:hypothetical protein n=1 Tax=Streptomyces noursei TaxID=1971 RepID=UPI00382D3C58